jgi:hypothetical protein
MSIQQPITTRFRSDREPGQDEGFFVASRGDSAATIVSPAKYRDWAVCLRSIAPCDKPTDIRLAVVRDT